MSLVALGLRLRSVKKDMASLSDAAKQTAVSLDARRAALQQQIDAAPDVVAARATDKRLREQIEELLAVIAEGGPKAADTHADELANLRSQKTKSDLVLADIQQEIDARFTALEDGIDGDDGRAQLASPMGQLMAKVHSVATRTEALVAKSTRALESLEENQTAALSQTSEGLRKLLEASQIQGDSLSAAFDPSTGQFQGGAFSDKYAFELVQAFAAYLERADQTFIGPALAERMAADRYFRDIFGNKFGSIERLARELLALQREQMQTLSRVAEPRSSSTSGAAGRPTDPKGCGTQPSLSVLKWSGTIR